MKHSDYGEAKALGAIAILFCGVFLGGQLVRGESSPWFWEELNNHHRVQSFPDVLVLLLCYAAFYSLGFFIPYWVTTFVLFMRRPREGRSDSQLNVHDRSGRLSLSCSGLVLFLLLQRSLIAFIRALPDQWDGFLLISGIALSALLAGAAALSFRESRNAENRTREKTSQS